MLKKITLCLTLLFVLSSITFAAYSDNKASTTITLKGELTDLHCTVSGKAPEHMKADVKACALECADSGYGIYSDGKLSKFDKASKTTIIKFLKKEDSKLKNVVVVAKKSGDLFTVVSIKN